MERIISKYYWIDDKFIILVEWRWQVAQVPKKFKKVVYPLE